MKKLLLLSAIFLFIGSNLRAQCSALFEYVVDGTDVAFEAFTEPGPGDVDNYLWDFGDGSTDEGDDDPNHDYTEVGEYEVCLTVIFEDSCVAEYCTELVIDEGIGGCDVFLDATTIDGLGVQFFAYSEPESDVVEYTFDFGDGSTFTETSTSDGSDPWHEYTESGIYTVCVEMVNNDGCVAETCIDVLVGDSVVGDCTAILEIWDTDGLGVHFFGFVEPEDVEVEYTWYFGDGETFSEVWSSEGSDPWHEYTESGWYTVCLVIETSTGCIDETCLDVYVGEPAGDCSAEFGYTADGTDVDFEAFTVPGPGDVLNYIWNFGDGTTDEGDDDPNHEYAEPGEYEVCLTVIFWDSCTVTVCDVVYTGITDGECDADFEYEIDGTTVTFINTSEGLSPAYTWDFGDGDISYSEDPIHTFTEPGTYEICLTVFGADSCVDTYCTEIELEESDPDCEAFFDIASITPEGDGWWVEFENGSDGDYDGHLWSFGDGEVSIEEDPEYYYAEAGTYLVCIAIGDTSLGCTDLYCEEIVLTITDGVYNNETTHGFDIFPNPAADQIYIKHSTLKDFGVHRAFSFDGSIIPITINPSSSGVSIQVNNLPEGYYMLEIVIEGGFIYQPIIIQH